MSFETSKNIVSKHFRDKPQENQPFFAPGFGRYTCLFSDALPFEKTPVLAPGLSFNIGNQKNTKMAKRGVAYCQPIFSDIRSGKAMHQCKSRWDFGFLSGFLLLAFEI